jgi:putative ABC transport system permease protein
VLLTGGSLLFRTVQNLWAVNPGFNPRHAITFQVGLAREATQTAAGIRSAYRQLVDRIRQIPGVLAADISALVPLSRGANEGPFWVGPHQPASMAEIPRAIYYPIGPDYVSVMQIPLLSGRLLSPTDNRSSDLVVLVDTLLARRYFPGQDAVGRTITIPHWGAALNVRARVMGILGHVEHYGLDGSVGEKPQIYYSFYQLPDEAVPIFRSDVELVVRTSLHADILMPSIKNAVHQAGGDRPVYNVRTIEELVSRSMGRQRFPMFLLAAFAILALLLAFVGIYGVISYSTARRVNEIGIRTALGAMRADVLRMVLRQGLRLALTGVSIGVAAALVLAKVFPGFSSLLYKVRATDPVILLVVSGILIGAALLGCYVPAKRAAKLEPAACIRQD